jgi:gamma-glutamyl:cysteine ligase YbdK (ATP-grasp superfamily)
MVRPHARRIGSEDSLAEIERILEEGNGADWQRGVAKEVGVDGLVARLAGIRPV